MSLNKVVSLFEVPTVQSTQAGIAAQDLDQPHPETGLKYGGFMPLRCSLFSPDIMKALSPGEVVLLLYLTFLGWRYPAQPGCVRAALPYLAKGTGMGRTAIHSYLNHLELLGLIKCTEVNQKLGNLYQIKDIALWTDDKPPELQQLQALASPETQITVTSPKKRQSSGFRTTGKRTTPVRNPDDNSSNSELHPSGKRTEDYTSLDSSTLSYSLSTELPKSLVNYFSSLKAYKKRESEKGHCLSLQKDFSISEIAEALDYLLGYGVPASGERCHSPMAYLSQAMNEVLLAVKAKEESLAKTETQEQQKEARQRIEQEARVAEEQLLQSKRTAFERAFPTREATEKHLAEFAKKYPVLNAKGPVLLNLAMIAWSAENQMDCTGVNSGAKR